MEYSFTASWDNLLNTFAAGINDWGSLHPIIVHTPIALLFAAPLFILLGLFIKRSAKVFHTNALILLTIGTLSIFAATSTGEKASEFIEPNPALVTTLDAHIRLAEQMRLNFSILTSILMTYILLYSYFSTKFNPKIHQSAIILFLLFYAFNLILLFNTAHQGGKLVHHHGITSNLYTDKHFTD